MMRVCVTLCVVNPLFTVAQVKTSSTPKQQRFDLHGDPLSPGAVARIGTMRFRHGRELRAVTFSPDGKRLATSAGDRAVSIWNFADGKELHRFQADNAWGAVGLSFSPDGQMLAVADNALQVHDTQTGKLIFQAKNNHRYRVVRFASDGKTLLTSGIARPNDGGFVDVWDVRTWKPIKQFEAQRVPLGGFSPDGRLFIQAAQDKVWLCSTATGKMVRALASMQGDLEAIAYSKDGRYLTTADDRDNKIRVFDLKTGKIVFQVRKINRRLNHLSFGNNKTLIEVNALQKVRIYDLAKKQMISEFDSGEYMSGPFGVSPNGKWIVGGSSFRMWRLSDGMQRNLGFRCGNFARFLPDGKRIVVGSQSPKIFDAATGRSRTDELKVKIRRSIPAGFFPQVSSDGRHRITLVSSDRLDLIDERHGKVGYSWNSPGGQFHSARFSKDGERILIMKSCPSGNPRIPPMTNVQIYNTRTKRIIFDRTVAKDVWNLFGRGCRSFVLSGDNRLTAIVDHKNQIGVWELASNRRVIGLDVKGASDCKEAMFTADGRLFAEVRGFRMRQVTIWDVVTGEPIRVMGGKRAHVVGGNRTYIFGIDFSANGRRLLSIGGWDGAILVWNIPQRKYIQHIPDKTLQLLWNTMRNPDPKHGWRAARRLEEASKVVRFLKQVMKPTSKPSKSQLQKLIDELDNDVFRIRKRAINRLAEFGEDAAPALRAMLKKKTSLEQQQQIRLLLDRLKTNPPGRIRLLRAVGVLEHIGSREARALLRELAKRPFHPRVRQDIAESLARLRVRPLQ